MSRVMGWEPAEPLTIGDEVRLANGEVQQVVTVTPRVMKQPRKDVLRERLALAEAQAAYHAGMRPMARLARWWARVRR